MKHFLSLLFVCASLVSWTQTKGVSEVNEIRFFNGAGAETGTRPRIYYNFTSQKFRVLQNGVWSDLLSAGGSAMTLPGVETSTGKKTFQSDAVNPGINIGSTAFVPSSTVDADLWYRSAPVTIGFKAGGVNSSILFSQNLGAVNNIPVVVTATGQIGAVTGFNIVSNNLSVPGKGIFTTTSTTAGLNVGSFSSDPSSLSNFDLWGHSGTNTLNVRLNGVTVPIVTGTVSDIIIGGFSNRWRLRDVAVPKNFREIRYGNSADSYTTPVTVTHTITNGGTTDYSNTTILDVTVTYIGIKSDGSASFSAKRSGTMRLSGGTWTLDNQRAGDNLQSVANTFGATPIVLLINGGVPSVTLDISGPAPAATYFVSCNIEIIGRTQ